MRELKAFGTALAVELLLIFLNKYMMPVINTLDVLYYIISNIILLLFLFMWKYSIDKKESDKKQKDLMEALIKHYRDLSDQLSKKLDK